MIQCPSCARRQEPRLICDQCGTPLAADLDLFAALGLPYLLQINLAKLEGTYHDLGRRIHPDRFASASPAVRDGSLRATALVTRAYRTLRDPVSRGLYWLELHGHKLADNNKQVSSDIAELVFEVQEQLSDLRAAREAGDDAHEGVIELNAKRASLRGLLDELYAELVESFAEFDTGEANAAPASSSHSSPSTALRASESALGNGPAVPLRAGSPRPDSSNGSGEVDRRFANLKAILSKIAYLKTLLRDVDRELDVGRTE
jgi:molecular chaperone HscB